MVKNGQPAVVERGYRNPTRPGWGLEVLTWEKLRDRLSPAEFLRPHRLDFHQLTLVSHGEGAGTVDFVDHPCSPGTLLHVRPGQVHRLPRASDGTKGLDATIVLFTPDFPPRLPTTVRVTDDPFGIAAWQLDTADHHRFRHAFSDLATEYASNTAPEITRDLLRQLLAAVLLRIARLPVSANNSSGAPAEPFRLFEHELERSFAVSHRANDYSARLGYSLKTLDRACLRSTGHTTKHLIDTRVTLEAKRLLAHTELPVAVIGRRLGFTEATNFGKFFARTTGQTPGHFRDTQT